MRFAYEKLAPWLTKIFPLAMPQILVANVIFCNYVAKVRIFPDITKLFSDYFATFSLFQFFTFDICILEKPEAEILS